MVLRREYGATGSASHSGHSESFVIAACAAPGAIAAATALAPAAALRESAARRLLEPRAHRGAARLAELVSHSSAGRTRLGASTAGAASSANTNTMSVGVRRLVLERARGDDTNAQGALAD